MNYAPMLRWSTMCLARTGPKTTLLYAMPKLPNPMHLRSVTCQ